MPNVSVFKTIALAAIAALALAGGADAKPGKGKGAANAPATAGESSTFSADVGISIHIGDDHGRIVRDYYSGAEHCPPGLAKKRNGCLPPGQAKKLYRVGHPIPANSIIVELPYGIAVRLPALPHGQAWRLVDGDLAVVDTSTRIVIDARAIF